MLGLTIGNTWSQPTPRPHLPAPPLSKTCSTCGEPSRKPAFGGESWGEIGWVTRRQRGAITDALWAEARWLGSPEWHTKHLALQRTQRRRALKQEHNPKEKWDRAWQKPLRGAGCEQATTRGSVTSPLSLWVPTNSFSTHQAPPHFYNLRVKGCHSSIQCAFGFVFPPPSVQVKVRVHPTALSKLYGKEIR